MFAFIPLCCHWEHLCFTNTFSSQDEEGLSALQSRLINQRKTGTLDNVLVVVFSPDCSLEGNTQADVLEALDGKYDALRDKLLAEALMKQVCIVELHKIQNPKDQKKKKPLKC